MRFVRCVLPALGGLLLWLLPIASPLAAPDGWTRYFASQDRPTPWAGLIRGVGRGLTGMALLDERQGRLIAWETLTQLRQEVHPLVINYQLLIPVGGLESGRDQGRVDRYLDTLHRDRGSSWQFAVYFQATVLGRLAGDRQRIYWQVGNEINSRYYQQTLSQWLNERQDLTVLEGDYLREFLDPPTNPRNHRYLIPVYVEYFLAPTVAALEMASQRLYGQPGQIPIVLGTLANARNPNGQAWLEELLDYTVQGHFAPGLKGRRVNELVDIIALHYLVTQHGDAWRETLNRLRNRWLGQGRISGIWSTEEIGGRRAGDNLGAATALRVTLRYLDWWLNNGFTPRQGRNNFWGWRQGDPGSRAYEVMELLVEFLGTGELSRFGHQKVQLDSPALEYYAFTTQDKSRRVIGAFPRNEGDQGPFGQVSLAVSRRDQAATARLYVFSPQGRQIIPVKVESRDRTLLLTPEQAVELGSDEAALLTVELLD